MSSHGCAKDEIVYKPIKKLFNHYPQWVRSKQFRQEVTFCMVKMVLSSVYSKFPSEKGCLFHGYITGYVTNSVGLIKLFASSQLHGCVYSVFTCPTSVLQSTRQIPMDENDLNSSQFVRKMASNRGHICFSVYWVYHSRSRVVFLCNNGSRRSLLSPTHPEWQFAVHCHTTGHGGYLH